MPDDKDSILKIFEGIQSDPKKIFLMDGGTGEELFARGVPDDRKIWSATAIVKEEYHNILKETHQSFIRAGSEAITANSYGIVPGVGFRKDEIAKYCAVAAKIARESIEGFNSLVLGSLGPLIESYRPDKILPHLEGVEYYRLMVEAMQGYVDLFLVETMSCAEEATQAIEAIGSGAPGTPTMISYTLSPSGEFRNGESPTDGLKRTIDYCHERKVKVVSILFNCAEPEAITFALQKVKDQPKLQEQMHKHGIV